MQPTRSAEKRAGRSATGEKPSAATRGGHSSAGPTASGIECLVIRGGADVIIEIKCTIIVYVSRSVVSNSLRSHGLQPARLLCP